MVEDINFTLGLLERIADEARNSDISLSEKAGLYAALERLVEDVQAYIREDSKWDIYYASEKISKFAWSVRAMLGFDIDNGHSASQHYSWALGSMSTLRNVLKLDKEF